MLVLTPPHCCVSCSAFTTHLMCKDDENPHIKFQLQRGSLAKYCSLLIINHEGSAFFTPSWGYTCLLSSSIECTDLCQLLLAQVCGNASDSVHSSIHHWGCGTALRRVSKRVNVVYIKGAQICCASKEARCQSKQSHQSISHFVGRENLQSSRGINVTMPASPNLT